MGAAERLDPNHHESEPKTLGDILYANKSRERVSEREWVRVVGAIAAGDQIALHSLYEQTHRIVFTLAMRITNNRETAEEVTLDVFHDVWRNASTYDAADGSVVGWIMNQARSRAIDPLRFKSPRLFAKSQLQTGGDMDVTRTKSTTLSLAFLLLVWPVNLKPGEKREFSLKLSVEHPGEIAVSGLD